MSEATPIPWRVSDDPALLVGLGMTRAYTILAHEPRLGDSGWHVAYCFPGDVSDEPGHHADETDTMTREIAEANAALIVTAVNAHAALVAACEAALKLWDRYQTTEPEQSDFDEIRAALALARTPTKGR